MFENIINFFKKLGKKDENMANKDTAKERLHLVLMQDRANVSADFLDMMKQEIIEVIKKYIDVDENEIDVKLTNKQNSDGTTGAPALYANIPIVSIKDEARKIDNKFALNENKNEKSEDNKEVKDKEAKNKETSNKENKNEEASEDESSKEEQTESSNKKEENKQNVKNENATKNEKTKSEKKQDTKKKK